MGVIDMTERGNTTEADNLFGPSRGDLVMSLAIKAIPNFITDRFRPAAEVQQFEGREARQLRRDQFVEEVFNGSPTSRLVISDGSKRTERRAPERPKQDDRPQLFRRHQDNGALIVS